MAITSAEVQSKVEEWQQALKQAAIRDARRNIPSCDAEVQRLRQVLTEITNALGDIPRFEVAFLGPSRQGKSTLLNALTGTSVLPMSDMQPCTASIVTLGWADQWQVKIRFVGERRLQRELKIALEDAEEEISRRDGYEEEDVPDDPRLFQSVLQRFLLLHGIETDRPPRELLEYLRVTPFPESIREY